MLVCHIFLIQHNQFRYKTITGILQVKDVEYFNIKHSTSLVIFFL